MSRTPPGPSGLDIARWVRRAQQDTFRAFAHLARDFGAVVRFPFSPAGAPLYILSSPDGVKHVLQDNHRNYKKAMTYDFLKPVVGHGLLTSEGDLWLRQRRLVAPIFHRRQIQTYVQTMIETTGSLLDEWERRREPFDVAAEMSQLTLSIAGKLLFNRDIGEESSWIGENMTLLFRDVNRRLQNPLAMPRQVPTPQNRRVKKAIDQLEDLVFGLIDERTGREDEYEDLLSMFMQARDEETGEKMSKEQIRDELMTFIIAGHETTSNHLSWTLYLLSQHPDVRRRLEAEIDENVGGDLPTLEEVRELELLEKVMDESLRIYPPAWTIEREPIEDDEFDGYLIEAGSIVVVGPYFVHHNANVWPNPEGFDPERERPDHRYAHFPFGGGPRMCVGADFAILETKLILAAIVKRFRLDVVPCQFVEAEGTVTLYPREGIEMTLARR